MLIGGKLRRGGGNRKTVFYEKPRKPREIVALIGHNGAGKSTLLKAVFGLIPIWQGRVSLDGKPVAKPAPREWLRAGVAYVPQGNRVFSDLTVAENLEMGGITLSGKQVLKDGIG
jgi:branched-chain amino acid transport system ATP-binding protein